MKITDHSPITSKDILCLCVKCFGFIWEEDKTLCVQLAKTSAALLHTFTLFCPSGLCFISCYNQHMDVFIVNSMHVNSSTHISFPPHTLPPLRKASNNLIENIFSNRISFKTLGLTWTYPWTLWKTFLYSIHKSCVTTVTNKSVSYYMCHFKSTFLETLTQHRMFFFFFWEIVIKKHNQRLIRMDTQTFT